MKPGTIRWCMAALCLLLLSYRCGYAGGKGESLIAPLRWGMSFDAVKAKHLGEKVVTEKEDELTYYADGVWHTVNYGFAANRLTQVKFSHTYYDDEDLTKENYEKERDGFIAQIGKPDRETAPGSDDEVADYVWVVDSTEIHMEPIGKESYWVVYTDLRAKAKTAVASVPGSAGSGATSSTGTIVFQDNFDSNANGWDLTPDEKCTKSIENGAYVVDHRDEESDHAFWHKMDFDSTKDFTVEVTTKWLDNNKTSGYGLIWNHLDWNNTRYFLITANGSFKFFDKKDGDGGAKSWTSSYHINKDGEGENTLKIRRTGNQVSYYINDYLVFTTAYRGFLGRWFGFYVAGNQKVQFDNFRVTAEPAVPAHHTLKPGFGNFTIYTSESSLLPLQIHIDPVKSLDDMQEQLDAITNGKPPRFGSMSGHYAILGGTLIHASECLPVNDPYDGTNGNNDQPVAPSPLNGEPGLAVGPFAGKNWNNAPPNSLSDRESGDYYYSIDLPYGQYKVTFSMWQGTAAAYTSAFGESTIVINKPGTILPVRKNE